MKFSLDKYHYFFNKDRVIAVSTFAGKPVRGVAICADRDEFSVERGKKLAAARCNVKVAQKRKARATRKMKEAAQASYEASVHYAKMVNYFDDACRDEEIACNELNELLEKY